MLRVIRIAEDTEREAEFKVVVNEVMKENPPNKGKVTGNQIQGKPLSPWNCVMKNTSLKTKK